MIDIGLVILGLLFEVLIFVIASIPLYLAVKLLGGKTSLLKTALISFIAGIIVVAVKQFFGILGGLIAFLILIWIYHEAFRLKWLKAFFAWLLNIIIIAIIYLIFFVILLLIGLNLFLF